MNVIIQLFITFIFLVPGYIIYKAKQSVTETYIPSQFELTVQSVIYSTIIYFFYFIIPCSRNLINYKNFFGNHTIDIILSINFLYAIIWVSGITFLFAVINMIWKYNKCYMKLVQKFGFKKMDEYLNTWECFCDKAIDEWVNVELNNNDFYIGVLAASNTYPFEPEILLRDSYHNEQKISVKIYDSAGNLKNENTYIKEVLINAKNIRTISICEKN